MSSRYWITILLVLLSFNSIGQDGDLLFTKAENHLINGKKRKAIQLFENALELAEKNGKIDLAIACHLELADLKNNLLDYKEALNHYKSFSNLYREKVHIRTEVLQDSVTSLSSNINHRNQIIKEQDKSLDSLTEAQMIAQLDIAKLEIEKQKHLSDVQTATNRRNILIFLLGIGFIVFFFTIRGYTLKQKNNTALTAMNSKILDEKKKSDELLLNILPEKVAKDLKENGKAKPMKYDMATVMFTDFKGFTKFSEEKSPEDIVAILDYYFCGFDNILSDYRIEKIKTIGDAYLCVSGLPDENPDQINEMIACAQNMLDFVEQAKHNSQFPGQEGMEIRIGIHCGPLVAGIVGTKKFAYDIWGDTVNIAARMEQSGVPSRINVSEDIYKRAPEGLSFVYRGEIEAKNKGKLKMYLVE